MADELSLFGAMLGEPDSQLGRLLEGMFTAQVTAALTRLGVPDQLAGGPLTAAELAPRLGASAGGLERMLTAATAYGLVSQDSAGRYSLTPVGAALRADAADSAQDFAVGFLAPPMWASIGRLAEVVRNPEPVNPAAPGGVYAYYAEHPEESAYFVRARGRTTQILVSQLAKVDFRPLLAGRIVDVGGSRGTLLAYLFEYVLPDDPEPSLAHLLDLIMMLVVGGRERTRAEHEALIGPAGYHLVRDTPVTDVLPWRVLEFERD